MAQFGVPQIGVEEDCVFGVAARASRDLPDFGAASHPSALARPPGKRAGEPRRSPAVSCAHYITMRGHISLLLGALVTARGGYVGGRTTTGDGHDPHTRPPT